MPTVSIIIACKNVEAYIGQAIESAMRQTVRDIEIIVIDDQSSDGTRDIIAGYAAKDTRILVLQGPARGPAAARNLGFAKASGQWIAILDGDDIMHPARLENLIALAQANNATIAADDLIAFLETPQERKAWLLMDRPAWREIRTIALIDMFRSSADNKDMPPVGYLKPVFRAELVKSRGFGYDESLRIGEDFDFVANMLLAGETFIYTPEAWYSYRRHSMSISYRLSAIDTQAMIAAGEALERKLTGQAQDLRDLVSRRNKRLHHQRDATLMLDALKARNPVKVMQLAMKNPLALKNLSKSLTEGLSKRVAKASASPAEAKTFDLVISDADERADAESADEGIRIVQKGDTPHARAVSARDITSLSYRAQKIRVRTPDLADRVYFGLGSETGRVEAA